MNKMLLKIKNYKIEIFVIILLFMAKFLGFIKNIFMAKYYGITSISDSYQMAISIPTIVLGIILYSYQAFTKGYFISEKKNNTLKYVSTFINFIIIILFLISLILLLLPEKFVSIFAPGFDPEKIEITINFLRPIIVGTAFLAISNILSEYLRCKNCYVISQFAYMVINIIEILSIIVAYKVNYMWLSYGYFLANFCYFIILALICKNKKIEYRPLIFEKNQIKIFISILIPIFVSSIITDVNSMVDKIFASRFETGIVSTLSYATNIKTVSLIMAAGYLTVLFPKISRKFVEDDYKKFNKKIKESLYIILSIYIPLTLLMIIFSKDICKIVYFRGVFDSSALIKTSNCLIMYTIGILGISIRDLYIKALYCMESGNVIIVVSIISVIFNIVFNIIFSNILGYIGLPLATSLSVWIILPFLIIIYDKNIKKNFNN